MGREIGKELGRKTGMEMGREMGRETGSGSRERDWKWDSREMGKEKEMGT